MYEPNFKKGDIIEYCDELYEVLENYGSSGQVREYPNIQVNNWGFQTVIDPFYWEYGGEKCTLVDRV